MSNHLLYTAIAALTIASPGPGIVLTLTNTIKYRFINALSGIFGVVAGMAIIGAIASSGLGVLLIASPYALTVIKVIGAAYLLYLGVKLFKSKPKALSDGEAQPTPPTGCKLFSEAFAITLFNPKPIVFFMALFPQFVDPTRPITMQFIILTLIFCKLVFIIHCLYACCAVAVRRKLSGDMFFIYLNRTAGIVFMLFGTALALSVIR